jgi:hypothetical protein
VIEDAKGGGNANDPENGECGVQKDAVTPFEKGAEDLGANPAQKQNARRYRHANE